MNQVVYVIDDDEAVRDAIKMLLQLAGLTVETFNSASVFLKDYRPNCINCLILDIRMPGMSGLELQEELHKRRIRVPIIFLTGHADVPMAVQALKKGAFDFIEKPLDSQRLTLTVMNALRLNADQQNQIDERIQSSESAAERLALLSDREREVLNLILQGKQTRIIAAELHISVKTVEFHRARIREKLKITSLAELFRLFL
jgi:FixJ family two-component response regulator